MLGRLVMQLLAARDDMVNVKLIVGDGVAWFPIIAFSFLQHVITGLAPEGVVLPQLKR